MQENYYDQREETYGTAGVDAYHAKHAAAKCNAIASATGALGLGTNLAGADNALVRRTPMQDTCEMLDQAIGTLVELRQRQDGFVDRARGPMPENTSKGEASGSQHGGALGAIEVRLMQLNALANRVLNAHIEFIDTLA